MRNTNDIMVGEKFKYDGRCWVCTGNDGFIFRADNLDITDCHTNMMFVGMSADVEIML